MSQVSITGERIPDPQPPFVQPGHTASEHIDAAERLLASLHKYYGDQKDPRGSSSTTNAVAHALMALAHGVLALASK